MILRGKNCHLIKKQNKKTEREKAGNTQLFRNMLQFWHLSLITALPK